MRAIFPLPPPPTHPGSWPQEVLASFRPDLVLYDAGVDVHVHDALGRLAVTDQGLYRRSAGQAGHMAWHGGHSMACRS